jgi:hypothetical protein
LDQALDLQPHQQTSAELKQTACTWAVFVPLATAANLLARLTALPVSRGAVWHWTQDVGPQAMTRLNDELEKLAAGQSPTVEALDEKTAAHPLLVGADGVMVPFRPAGGQPKGRTVWREIKLAILARLGRRSTCSGPVVPRLEHRRLVAVLGDLEALRPRLWLEALRQGLPSARQVAWLSDGGRGFWGLLATCFADWATGILDFYPAAENLWAGAAAWLDGRSKRAREWFVSARHRLRHGEADGVVAEVAAALELHGLPASARETLIKLPSYVEKHRAPLDYERFKELGLPIGSGLVESACKWLIQPRFKGVGMRWSEDGFNHLLHLRLAWVNCRFDALFTAPSPN